MLSDENLTNGNLGLIEEANIDQSRLTMMHTFGQYLKHFVE